VLVTDPVGRETEYQYNDMGWQTQMRLGDYQIDNVYDAAGQLIRQLGPAPDRDGAPNNRLITDFAFDLRGNNISISDNLGRLFTSVFNLVGELIGFT
jgi:uncharacterized protein RhaS with RHS repeats